MKIQKISLKNFRNYECLNLNFHEGINIIYGNNGSGKSNLIESIYFLALTKSFRTVNDLKLIKNNESFFNIKGTIIEKEKTNFEVNFSKEGKKVYIDFDKITKISDYVTNIHIILFNPLDDRIINETPAVRRKYLDIEISQLHKEYMLLLGNYNKLLKNRNAFLKQIYLNANASRDYLDILTKKLISYGIKIYEYRKNYLDEINKYIGEIYENIFGYGQLKLKYKSVYLNKSEKEIEEYYKKNINTEINYCKTLYGIQHDDYDFILDDNLIRDFGSVGQQKNAIISYKLSQILGIKNEKGMFPILILDDLFSELDKKKINNIISMLNSEVQTFITTTDIKNVDKKLIKNSAIFKIENGNVERMDSNEK